MHYFLVAHVPAQKLIYLLNGVVGSDFAQRVHPDFEAFQLLVYAGLLIGLGGFLLGFGGFLGHLLNEQLAMNN